MAKNGHITTFFKAPVESSKKRAHDDTIYDNIVVGGVGTHVPQIKSQIDRSRTSSPHKTTRRTSPSKKASTTRRSSPELQPPPTTAGAERTTDKLSPSLSPLTSVPSSPVDVLSETRRTQQAQEPIRAAAQRKQDTANRSFPSFTSTLSSIPSSSQSSSRRVVRNGAPVVMNSSSDLESIDEKFETSSQQTVRDATPAATKPINVSKMTDSDSDSLDDIDEILAPKKPSVRFDTPHSLASGGDLRRSTRKEESRFMPKRNVSPPRKKYKNSLAALIKQKTKDEALEARIKNLEASISKTEASVGSSPDAEDDIPGMRTHDAVAAIEDDEEEGQRLKQVMKRMDALQEDVRFQFFERRGEEEQTRPSFPEESLSPKGWTKLLRNVGSRDHTVLSGCAAEMARVSALSEEVQEWMLNERKHTRASDTVLETLSDIMIVFFEMKDELSHAYIGILEVHTYLLLSAGLED